MKKLIFFFVFGAILNVSAAEDSYLYWMVSDNASGWGWDGQALNGDYTAKIVAFKGDWAGTGGSPLDIGINENGSYLLLGNEVSVTFGQSADNFQYLAKLAADWSDFSYFVEIYNDSKNLVARSEGLFYAQENIAVLSGLNTPATPWMVASFTPAPEPNSALLLLIGCAALALRRRKQIAA